MFLLYHQVFDIVSKDKIKSTNEVRNELEAITGKKINWYIIHRMLSDLMIEGKIERYEAASGFFWKKVCKNSRGQLKMSNIMVNYLTYC